MKTRIDRLIAVLLALTLVLGLTACGSKDGGGNTAKNLAFQTAPAYIMEDLALPVETGALDGCCADGQSMWFLARPEEDAPPVLCRMPLDSETEAEALAEYQPPVSEENGSLGFVGPIQGGDGKLWVWEQVVTPQYDLPESFDPETEEKGAYFSGNSELIRMRQLDPKTGKELKTVDVTAVMGELGIMSFHGIAVDKAGTIYLANNKQVVAVDDEGQTLFTLKESMPKMPFSGSGGGALAVTPDGAVAVLIAEPGEKRIARFIDPETRDWREEQYTLHSGVDEIYSGYGECLFYYVSSEILYGIVPGNELPQRLLPWSSARLENPDSVMGFALMDEGRAAILTNTYTSGLDMYSGHIQAFRLNPADKFPDDDRATVVLGMIGEDVVLRQRVKQFNRRSKDYYVEIRDYAEGMIGPYEKNEQLHQSAVTRLYAEMASGQSPDILVDSIPLVQLGRLGALEDLWPWIDNDPELGRDKVMAHVLECAETEGKLYRICGGFAIETAVASAKVAGDRTGWTMEEMQAAFGEMPELYFGGIASSRTSRASASFNRLDKKAMLYQLIKMGLDRYVNQETGECSFDSEDFKNLLLLAGSSEEAGSSIDLEDRILLLARGVWDTKADAIETCQVFPWEGEPILYSRTLSEPSHLVLDDVLFGGQDVLTDYEQRLWDADIVYTWISPYNGNTITSVRCENTAECAFDQIKNTIWHHEHPEWSGRTEPLLAADYVYGGADGSVRASYVGFPAQNGTGSSFSLYDSMAISAASEVKEGAWAFIRNLLLPNGNTVNFDEPNTDPSIDGFPMNRASLEESIGRVMWIDQTTGEPFLDSEGNPVEYSERAVSIGNPIVLMAYLLPPSDAQRERFWNLYNAIDHVTGENDDLLDIITEQALPYFAGDKSLEDTVKLIQNRAQLYISENQ